MVVVKKVSAQLSREGCFDLLTPGRCGEQNRRHAAAGRQLLRRRAHPREAAAACRASVSWRRCLPPGVSWETDDNGFIISARGKETTATYRYDSDGYPLGKTTTAKEERFTSRLNAVKGRVRVVLYRHQHLQRSHAGHGASDLRLRRSRQSAEL